VTVQYLDMELDVRFEREGVAVTYLDADRRLFDRRSGFHGNMFPVDKLEGAMIRIADDIRQHYDLVLTGDEATWRRLDSVDTGTRSAFRIPD
jgi:hypothetical protein